MYIKGFKWSSNVLNLNIESFYKSITENKHNCQSQQEKKESNQTTTQIISRGKLTAQNPSIICCIFHRESWNNYNALFSQESPAICLSSHTDPNKIMPTLSQLSACLSHAIPNEFNPYSLGISTFLNYIEYHGNPMVF